MRNTVSRFTARGRRLFTVMLLVVCTSACTDDPPEKTTKDVATVPPYTPDIGSVSGDAGDVQEQADTEDDAGCVGVGCACDVDLDCVDSRCIDLGAGKRCQPLDLTLCAPCLTDAECAVVAEGAACVDRGSDGAFCGTPCDAAAACNEGYECKDAKNREGVAVKQCLPKDNKLCTCSDFAKDYALVTLCLKGKCPSERACLPAGHPDVPPEGGMSDCRPLQQPEKCDGLDNDCNGKVDDGTACNDGNPCTNDTCVGTTCAHTPALGACEDGDACTESDTCKGGACNPGTAKNCVDGVTCTTDTCDSATGCAFVGNDAGCDDGKPCTTDSCHGLGSGKAGCQHKPLDGCDPAFIVPHKELFTCDSKTANKWQLTGVVGGPRWGLDKTPDPPGFVSAPCSLNFNDGKNYECPKGLGVTEVGGTATSPWFYDAQHQLGSGLELRGKVSGDWEESGFDDLDVLISGDGKTWTKLGNIDWTEPKKWLDLQVEINEWAGKKFRLRFHFYSLDCQNNETQGPFIDDLELVAVPCALPKECNDGDACTTDTCDKAKGCVHTAKAACDTPVPVPYVTDFACGGAAIKQWTLDTNQKSPSWQIDGTPGAPGFLSAPCSLNFNNGKDYACSGGDTELHSEATTPRLSAAKLAPGSHLFARFSMAGSWEANEYDNLVLWGTVDGTEWLELANYDPPKSGWQKFAVDISQFAGTKFWLSFSFTTSDCTKNGGTGPFIDDFFVSPTACLTDDQCADSDPCTADTCKVGFGCQHPLKSGPCDDGSACTEQGVCDSKGKCVGKAVVCDDENKCTNNTCDPKTGCKSKPVDGCGPPLKVPLDDDFACASNGNAVWSLVGAAEGPAWAIDGTPSTPGYTSPLCSLNFNDGKNYACAPGQESVKGTATSHWIDMSGQDPGAKTLLSFMLAGAWEQGNWDRLRLLGTTDSKTWQLIEEFEHNQPFKWHKHVVDIGVYSGTKFRLRFSFETTDCFDNSAPGPFIDDLKLVVPPCAGNADCDDNNPCTDDSCGKNGVCARLKKTASCADADKCQIAPVCTAGKCLGKKVNCDDNNACTIDSCAPAKGCVNKAIPGCGGAVKIPYYEPFHCGSPSAGAWSLELGDAVTPAFAPEWGIDASPAVPGAASPLCSLNFNNDKTYDCGPGQSKIVGTATSLWFAGDKLLPGADLRVDFKLSGAWESNGFDKLLLLASTDGKLWNTVQSFNHTDVKVWSVHEVKLGAYAGVKFKLSFYFEASDCVANGTAGPFVDDLLVHVIGCDDDLACDDSNVCTKDTCGDNKTCKHELDSVACSDNNACTEGDKCVPAGCVGEPISCEDDKSPCTSVSCQPNLGCVIDHVQGKCDDGDPCTAGDACANGKCATTPKVCDDKNPCTVDNCLSSSKGCSYVAQVGPCHDGDVCTTAGVCNEGVCKSSKVCDDGNACTVDSCKKPANKPSCSYKALSKGTLCDDGDACTSADKCLKQVCVGGPSSCGCKSAKDCKDDGNPCTAAACTSGKCVKQIAKDGSGCDDGDKCTAKTACKNGQCAGKGKACDDGNVCTAATCNAKTGACTFASQSGACSDDNACTTTDACVAGKCAGKEVKCNDGNRCTNDGCDVVKGCEYTVVPDGGKCNDNNACTGPDKCFKGQCNPAKLNCDDKNPCTTKACHKQKGCSYAKLSGKCDDGDPCTGADACVGGNCLGKVKTCDDRNSCTVDSCDTKAKPANACKHVVVASGPCNDNDACTTKDACTKGKCVGAAKQCDDGSACTVNACDKKTGSCAATPTPVGGPCDDGNACTVADVCSKGACVGEAKLCDDGQSCTRDSCGAKGVCAHQQLGDGTPCDDGDACTLGDGCKASSCNGGAKLCVDADPCMNAGCDTKTGNCTFTPVPGDPVCNDGNACTAADKCSKGKCTGKEKDCSDTKACTTDTCDGADGACGHSVIPDGGGCVDGDACTKADLCKQGECVGVKESCNDGDACTTDSCNAKTGCAHAPGKDGAACDDNSACTSADACKTGACVGKFKSCDDGTGCTADTCDATTGHCNNAALPGGCDDGNACTSGDKCLGGVCGGSLKACGKGGPCNADSCDPKSGKCTGKPAADGGACDDGNACTGTDVCKSGTCAGSAKGCSDGNSCTANQCNAKTGACANPPRAVGADCDDNDACTSEDRCANGNCVGTVKDCADNNGCTADSCSKTGSCQHVPIGNGGACDDGNACTAQDTCASGACKGVTKVCESLETCLKNVCGSSGECKPVVAPDGGQCDDGDPCTSGEKCAAGGCVGKSKVCDDGKPCTADFCWPLDGSCKSNPVDDGTSCSDNNHCTTSDVCANNVCKGIENPCDDANPCTTGKCSPAVDGAAKCVQTPANDGSKCDDSSACTAADTCTKGACGGKAKACVDGPCKSGSCDPGNGSCGFTDLANGTVCSDGNLCTTADGCDKGACRGTNSTCSDANPCTADACDSKTGKCTSKADAAVKVCNDGDVCTTADACAVGKCVGQIKSCGDGNTCTADSCNKVTGNCVNSALDGVACSDGNACSESDSCATGVCKGSAKVCLGTETCTVHSCDPKSGCKSTAIAACKNALKVPYNAAFDCGGAASKAWQLAAAGGKAPVWSIDGSPAKPGFASKSCSLNFNNGTDYACPTGVDEVSGVATSPWLDASAVKVPSKLIARFKVGGSWEGAPHDVLSLFAVVDGQATPVLIGIIAPVVGGGFGSSIAVDVSVLAGTRFALRLSFSTNDCSNNAGSGPFIDDLFVGAAQCLTNAHCATGEVCTINACVAPVKAGPDLVVGQVLVDASAPPATKISFSVRVTNKGDKALSGAFDLGFVVAENADGSGKVAAKWQWNLAGGLSVGQTRKVGGWFKMSSSHKPGIWHLVPTVDPDSKVEEKDETNNRSAGKFTLQPAPKADLQVTKLTATATVQAGTDVTVNWQVDNTGKGAALGSSLGLFISPNTSFFSYVLLGSANVPSVAAGKSASGVIKLKIPATTKAGKYVIQGRADVGAAVTELLETNNAKDAVLNITAAKSEINLRPTLLQPSVLQASAGDKVVVKVAWTNDGNTDSGPFTAGLYLAAGSKVALTDTKLDEASHATVLAGHTKTFEHTITIPGTAIGGAHTLGLFVDNANKVAEGNEADNGLSIPMTLFDATGGPDLVSTATAVVAVGSSKTKLAAGDEFRFNPGMGCKNIGTKATGKFGFKVLYSKNPGLSGSDVPAHLGHYPVAGGLGAGQTYGPYPNKYAIPTSLSPGTWYIGVLCDHENVIAESDESNNGASFAVEIVGRPDLRAKQLLASVFVVKPGGKLTVKTAARNDGTGSAGGRTDRLVLDSNSAVSAAGIKLLEITAGALAAGGADALKTSTVTIPVATKVGTYYLGLLVDNGNTVAEADESNNSLAVKVTVIAQEPVVIAGKVTYDRVPALDKSEGGARLGLDKIFAQPARRVWVEAIDAADGKTVLATATTDDSGAYALTVPATATVKVRAHARLIDNHAVPDKIGRDACDGASWDVRVVDNTAERAEYVIDSPSLKGPKSAWNLHAATTHSGTAYTQRHGAPFALADDTLSVIELLCEGEPAAQLPLLYVNWSVNNNRAASGDKAAGKIGTPHYSSCGVKEGGKCVSAIFMGGLENFDTDEYDDHITGHEAGHFVERQFFRSDNIGGAHSVGAVVDMSMAWGEGYGTVCGALALGDPVFVDTSGLNQQKGWQIDLSQPRPAADSGVFSEIATARLVYRLWDMRNGKEGDGVGSFDRAFVVMKKHMAPGPSYSSPQAFGAYYNALFGAKAESFKTLWQDDFNTPYDALCNGSCAGSKDTADVFDTDNDVGDHFAAFKLYPGPNQSGAAKRSAAFWQLYKPLLVGTNATTGHDRVVLGYSAPTRTFNKVGTNRHYRLIGTGKVMKIRLHDHAKTGCAGNVSVLMQIYTVQAPRTRLRVAHVFGACPSATIETDKGRDYMIRVHGGYKITAGGKFNTGPDANVDGWAVSITEQ